MTVSASLCLLVLLLPWYITISPLFLIHIIISFDHPLGVGGAECGSHWSADVRRN